MEAPKHNDIVRQAFTTQASAYAANPSISDPDRIARLLQSVRASPESRVLEVATGPGYVAEAFAAICREVVGVDLTPAMLQVAERRQRERGPSNLSFRLADATRLPFAESEFDVVVCRLAFHHLENPAQVLGEMARVCRTDGAVAVEDLVVSENPQRGAFQNRFESSRDPSHLQAYPLSRLLTLFADMGLEVERVTTDCLLPDVEKWLANAHTPESAAALTREMIERDATKDLSGTRPFRDEDGRLRFRQRTATVVGRKLAPAGARSGPRLPATPDNKPL